MIYIVIMKLEHSVSNETIINKLMAEPSELFSFLKALANAIQVSSLPNAYDTSYQLKKIVQKTKDDLEKFQLEQYKESLAALFDDSKQDVKVIAAAMGASPLGASFDALLPPAQTENMIGWENAQKAIQEKRKAARRNKNSFASQPDEITKEFVENLEKLQSFVPVNVVSDAPNHEG